MDALALRASLQDLGLSQADLARLVTVTPRAVSLWLAGERAIPGSVEAYLRVLRMAPGELRYAELAWLRARNGVREGIFGVFFEGRPDVATWVLKEGRIFGVDPSGVQYDGHYTSQDHSGFADVFVTVSVPAQTEFIFDPVHPDARTFDIETRLEPGRDEGPLEVRTSLGEVLQARYVFLRGLPEVG